MKTIYLAGTISADEGTRWWRQVAQYFLRKLGHQVRDPLRGKVLTVDGKEVFSDIPGTCFYNRDLRDIRESDLLLVDLTHLDSTNRPSCGTFMEMGYALALGKPMIVMCKNPALLVHPFIANSALAVVEDLDEALKLVAFYFHSAGQELAQCGTLKG